MVGLSARRKAQISYPAVVCCFGCAKATRWCTFLPLSEINASRSRLDADTPGRGIPIFICISKSAVGWGWRFHFPALCWFCVPAVSSALRLMEKGWFAPCQVGIGLCIVDLRRKSSSFWRSVACVCCQSQWQWWLISPVELCLLCEIIIKNRASIQPAGAVALPGGGCILCPPAGPLPKPGGDHQWSASTGC